MAEYSIKDLETLSGIKAHTIRIWEKRYGLIEPMRSLTNIRSYSGCDLKKLLNITILYNSGLKISEIAKLNENQLNDKVVSLCQVSHKNQSHIESLIVSMIEFDEFKFQNTLSQALIQFGFEEVVLEVLYPFFSRVGVLWQTGDINPGNEHFISNLIKQKLFVSIDSLPVNTNQENSKLFLLFLPDWEMHELGLLFYYYLIKKRNHRVIYLGQNTPLEDAIHADMEHKVDFFFTSLTAPVSSTKLNQFFTQINKAFSSKRIFLTGQQISNRSTTLPQSMIKVKDAQFFTEHFDDLINE